MPINMFRGEYAFLSNMYECPVLYEGIIYKSAEAAFQAAKTLDRNERLEFTLLSPAEAKRKGRKIHLRTDWNEIRVQVMKRVVWNKFTQNARLAHMLLQTGNQELIEGNTWNDRFWGVDLRTGIGQNQLGQILMQVRMHLPN